MKISEEEAKQLLGGELPERCFTYRPHPIDDGVIIRYYEHSTEDGVAIVRLESGLFYKEEEVSIGG